jgi:hypothetical protein
MVVMLTIVVAGLFADIDHTIIAAVVVTVAIAVVTAAGLGDGVARAQFTTRAPFVVLANTAMVMIVVRVLLSIRATHNIILGLAGTRVGISGCIGHGY